MPQRSKFMYAGKVLRQRDSCTAVYTVVQRNMATDVTRTTSTAVRVLPQGMSSESAGPST